MEIIRLVRAEYIDYGEVIETTEGPKAVQDVEEMSLGSSPVALVKLTVEGRVFAFNGTDLISSRGLVGQTEGVSSLDADHER